MFDIISLLPRASFKHRELPAPLGDSQNSRGLGNITSPTPALPLPNMTEQLSSSLKKLVGAHTVMHNLALLVPRGYKAMKAGWQFFSSK